MSFLGGCFVGEGTTDAGVLRRLLQVRPPDLASPRAPRRARKNGSPSLSEQRLHVARPQERLSQLARLTQPSTKTPPRAKAMPRRQAHDHLGGGFPLTYAAWSTSHALARNGRSTLGSDYLKRFLFIRASTLSGSAASSAVCAFCCALSDCRLKKNDGIAPVTTPTTVPTPAQIVAKSWLTASLNMKATSATNATATIAAHPS